MPSLYLPLLHSRLPSSPEKELMHKSDTPVFAVATYGMPLDHVAMVPVENMFMDSTGLKQTEKVLNTSYPPGHSTEGADRNTHLPVSP